MPPRHGICIDFYTAICTLACAANASCCTLLNAKAADRATAVKARNSCSVAAWTFSAVAPAEHLNLVPRCARFSVCSTLITGLR